MTFEERMAELGVETRDFVPDDEHCKRLYDKFYAEAERICEKMSMELDAPFMVSLLLVAVANRDDIIDRMETRLVNVTGERDWLKSVLENHLFCETCVGGQGIEPCVNGHLCSTDNPNYRYSGVPEDWSVDE